MATHVPASAPSLLVRSISIVWLEEALVGARLVGLLARVGGRRRVRIRCRFRRLRCVLVLAHAPDLPVAAPGDGFLYTRFTGSNARQNRARHAAARSGGGVVPTIPAPSGTLTSRGARA